jgi:hypothetical protein
MLRHYTAFDPTHATERALSASKILMIRARYDLITSSLQYDSLVDRWGLTNVLDYKAGHLNTLRVPRLADDIAQFFDRLMAPEQGGSA